jgi:hypothetical protein
MGSYAGQLNAGDRWRVAMYVMSALKKAAAPAAAENKDAAAKDAPAEMLILKNKKKKMYSFSPKLRMYSIILIVVGLVLFGIGYALNHSIDKLK